MADDPNRDILPLDTFTVKDPRERHLVYKLDRYELEDKYLRLLEEAKNLKKQTNCQEDKIKRLATKLMRATATPRGCTVDLNVLDEKNKMLTLEVENCKLKNKISALRNQLLNHKICSRSSSRTRNPQARLTCRSESSRTSRTKTPSRHCITEAGDDDIDGHNNLDKYERFGSPKKGMASRIAELEKELSECTASNQRAKTADNIEYIKVWRQMKQLDDKLIAAEKTNKALTAQIDDLKWKLEEAAKKGFETSTLLNEERKRSAELDEEVLKARESQFCVREKDERIKDLLIEMKILQQHNDELVTLSSCCGNVEQENEELKKKVTEQLHNQESLKKAFCFEQANIEALQNSNEQLLGKLEELQRNIDSLTNLQTQTEKEEISKTTQISTKLANMSAPPMIDKEFANSGNQMEMCKKCCETFEKILQLEENLCVPHGNLRPETKCVQTEPVTFTICDSQSPAMSIAVPVKGCKGKEKQMNESANYDKQTLTEDPLTPGRMLKLLEQAQIDTPSNTVRLAQKNMIEGVECHTLDLNQRHSNTEMLVQANQTSQALQTKYEQQRIEKTTCMTQTLDSQFTDPNKILTILCNILQGYSQTQFVPTETTFGCPVAPIDRQFVTDANNNVTTKILEGKSTHPPYKLNVARKNAAMNVVRVGCSMRNTCMGSRGGPQTEILGGNIVCDFKKYNRVTKFDDVNDCSCNNFGGCDVDANSDQPCCGENPFKLFKDPKARNTLNNVVICDNPPRNLQAYDEEARPYNAWEKDETLKKENDGLDEGNTLRGYIEQLDRCKEIMNHTFPSNDGNGIPVKNIVNHSNVRNLMRYRDINDKSMPETQRTESVCSLNCSNECVETSSTLSDSFPMVIPDGQGLLELHVVSLQLSTSAKQVLFRENDINNVSLFVSWDMWNQDTTYTPTLKCPKLTFNSSFVYRISDLFSFFNYVLLELVIFKVNVFHEENDNYTTARGKLCIKDILDYPQNKLHYIAPVNSVLPCSLGINFGQLSLWVRLSCDVDKVDKFKKSRGIATEYNGNSTPEKRAPKSSSPAPRDDKTAKSTNERHERSKERETHHHVADTSSDSLDSPEQHLNHRSFHKVPLTVVKESEDEVHYVSSHENTSVTTMVSENTGKSENTTKNYPITINAIESPEAQLLKEDGKPKETIPKKRTSSVEEFNALITKGKQENKNWTGSDESISEVTNVISEKNWTEYKQRSLLTFDEQIAESENEALKTESDGDIPVDNNVITIDIESMILFPKSSVAQNHEIQLLYIEFSFLGYSGADMETISVAKPLPPETRLVYNFSRKFNVDEETHAMQNNILRSMLNDTSNPNIRFIVVSEPLPEETDLKECVEVGYADFNIKEYAFEDSEKVTTLPIRSIDETEQIGLLKIHVVGIEVIHQRLGRHEPAL